MHKLTQQASALILTIKQAIHDDWGGVVPQLAMAEHKKNIDKAIDAALKAAGFPSVESVDAIAVTKGPGLEVCLRVGMRKAQVNSFRSLPFEANVSLV